MAGMGSGTHTHHPFSQTAWNETTVLAFEVKKNKFCVTGLSHVTPVTGQKIADSEKLVSFRIFSAGLDIFPN
jgi:hypothetical protein